MNYPTPAPSRQFIAAQASSQAIARFNAQASGRAGGGSHGQRRPVRPKRERGTAVTPGSAGREQVIDLPEQVIEGEVPFEPQVSHPDAKRYVEGKGRIEASDLKAFGTGMVNALKPGEKLPVDPYNQRPTVARTPEEVAVSRSEPAPTVALWR